MADAVMVVIVPSRGRPANAARLIEAWKATTRGETLLAIVTDADDPEAYAYDELQLGEHGHGFIGRFILGAVDGQRLRLGGILNRIGYGYATESFARVIGFMGDDCVPRTEGWDLAVTDALTELGSGIVYGNDLLQGEKLPTAAFMTSDIIRTLGWMCPPTLEHLYIDNAWLELGRSMGRLRYLPEVVLEHMHPDAGKAVQDGTYREANAPERDRRDRAAFEAWRSVQLPRDLELLRAAGLC